MRYKFKIDKELSQDTFGSRDAAFAAGLLKAGSPIVGIQVVRVV